MVLLSAFVQIPGGILVRCGVSARRKRVDPICTSNFRNTGSDLEAPFTLDAGSDEDYSQEDVDSILANAGFTVAKQKPKKAVEPESGKKPKIARNRSVTNKDIIQFEREGHVACRDLLLEEQVEDLREKTLKVFEDRLLESYQQKCSVLGLGTPGTLAEAKESLETVDNDKIPFLQLFNLRKMNPSLLIPEQLAQAAATLLGSKRLRVYQDSIFVKRGGDGPTLWHSDLNMAPLDTNRFVTAWIPLHPVTEELAPLCFATGSHTDFSGCYWKGRQFLREEDLSSRYQVQSYSPLKIGDVTFHHGWTLHGTDGMDLTCDPRIAWTVSFFCEESTRLLPERFWSDIPTEDRMSYQRWIKEVKTSKPLNHPDLEVVFPVPKKKMG
ncbi:hypothetical protein NDN08_000057 [Rhodosorus marinus]|uniref:Phytanoyl-CoA dioxygenase n=1 Tax=Rhodosorus marinus TaxID=101924 RepID=A0AAV8UE87_9RHOD|nr:hypothetical protein NDN08_000057 [Rhodosorus marinus]